MRILVTIVSPHNYPDTEVTREVGEAIYYGLASLGHDTILTARTDCPGRWYIVLCPHRLVHLGMPLAAGSIL
jgi:hypothetical protein